MRGRRSGVGFWALWGLLASGTGLAAGPLSPAEVPEPLRPWTGWVLEGQEGRTCPFFEGNSSRRSCAWPSRLTLTLGEKGGTFEQTWRLDIDNRVPLPGDARRWPQEVTVNGKRVPVTANEDVPIVSLPAGLHVLRGRFLWDALPEALRIPQETGLVSLTLGGVKVASLQREASGQLFLQRTQVAAEGETLDVEVHRRVTDEVPLRLATRIRLNVSGKNREVLLGRALPDGFVPLSLEGPLPSRLEPDGRLRVQVRPGEWTLELTARSEGRLEELGPPAQPEPAGEGTGPVWDEDGELWAFEAVPQLRLVEVEGVPAIDASQTTLPEAWRALPTYPLAAGERMRLVERRRGNAEPGQDRLTLSRELWLDFDGQGYTVSDQVQGELRRAWRLEMAPETKLGRVAVQGRDVFITQRDGSPNSGVEVRQGELSLTADSRIEGKVSNVSAVGWDHDFHEVSGRLNLPPGWRLLHASGVDQVPGTWIGHWTLLELFLLLVLSLAVGRLYGVGLGALAAVTMALTFPETDAPKWAWTGVLAAEALVRALPEGRLRKWMRVLRWGAVAVLALVTLPFMVMQVRLGMYPAQETPWMTLGTQSPSAPMRAHADRDQSGAGLRGFLGAEANALSGNAAPPPSAPEPVSESESESESEEAELQGGLLDGEGEVELNGGGEVSLDAKEGLGAGLGSALGALKGSASDMKRKSAGPRGASQQNAYAYDPNAVVQTGPGVPRWSWQSLELRWSGPVERGQRLGLLLLSPGVNFVLAVVRVLLLAALVLVVVREGARRGGGGEGDPGDAGGGGGLWSRLRGRFAGGAARVASTRQGGLPGTAGASRAAEGRALLARSSNGQETGGRTGPGRRWAWPWPVGLAFVLAASLVPGAARAELPSLELQQALRQRLLRAPDCSPSCAASPRLFLEATPERLRVRMEVDAEARTAVPLPGGEGFVPETVLLDGAPATGLLREARSGQLWLAVTPGSHEVLLEGRLPDVESVVFALPLRPFRVEAKTTGWTLEGLHEDGVADANLQLTRVRSVPRQGGDGLQAGALPPFVRVERTLRIGLEWRAETRVVRLSPPGTAVVLEVPLLPGESVTTAEVRVQSGKALLNMGPQVEEVVWSSVLEERPELSLTAPTGLPWVERWVLDLGPTLHVELGGIPTVHPGAASTARLPEWRPWPGETVTLAFSRPLGIPGQTFTVDHSKLVVQPGLRATDATLTLTVRSSRGVQHVVKVPPSAQVSTLEVNGVSQPVRQEGQQVTLALSPGTQQVELAWRQTDGVKALYSVPTVDLGVPSVNAQVVLQLPEDRWVLFAGGPRAGPAVLFWSLLAVLVLVSLAMARIPFVPMRAHQWLLLGVGLSQVHIALGAVVAGWLLALGWKEHVLAQSAGVRRFNLFQLLLVAWTGLALLLLCVAVYEGLLGQPDMQVGGNGSSAYSLQWFQDRMAGTLPVPWVLSVPLLVYRGAMLAWALWLALAVLGWLRWGWVAFNAGGLWRRAPQAAPAPVAAQAPSPLLPPPPGTGG